MPRELWYKMQDTNLITNFLMYKYFNMKMNIRKTLPLLLISLFAVCFFYGCEKDASSQGFGNDMTKIFMPQAAIATMRYNVPTGLDSATMNYKIDVQNNKVNIILGVAASGAKSLSTYTVSVATNTDTINQMINTGVLPSATTVILPSTIYALPSSVTVPAGQSGSTFYLSIDKTQLKTYAGKTMALEVVLSNPTLYTLNTSLNKTIVLVNVSSLNL